MVSVSNFIIEAPDPAYALWLISFLFLCRAAPFLTVRVFRFLSYFRMPPRQ